MRAQRAGGRADFMPQPAPSLAPRRVLVVDDSAAFRHLVSGCLARTPRFEVVGAVGTLALARARIERGDVDAVTLDIALRGETGLDLLHWVRRHHPQIRVVLLSADASFTGIEALLLGATLITKPSGPGAETRLAELLDHALAEPAHTEPRSIAPPRPGSVAPSPRAGVATERVSSTAPPGRVTSVAPPFASTTGRVARAPGSMRSGPALRELIAIGASTGGPPVLVRLFQDLGPSFEVPIVVVQHMAAAHIEFFVALLAQQCRRTFRLAAHGMLLEPRTVYIAGGERHLRVGRERGRLVALLDDGPPEHHCKPAVDPLFRSVAAVCGAATVGVVATGMGTDGAAGAVALRDAGAPVVVQDQASSVVWGMPGAVVAANAADAVVPGNELAAFVLARTSGWKSSHEESGA
jgi:two-component system chemotaxis response regulator CheB